MKGLPKAIIKKYGISKKAWKVFREGKVNKGRTTKRKSVGVKKVTKRKRRYTRKTRRRRKMKIPLEVAIAGIAIPLTPAQDGWATPIAQIQDQAWDHLGDNLKSGFLGMGANNEFDVMKALNPFDMSRARYTKMLIWAGIISKLRKRAVTIPFDKVPLIGKYIS